MLFEIVFINPIGVYSCAMCKNGLLVELLALNDMA